MSFFVGGNNRARTCDPLLVRQVLSQLSYASVVNDIYYSIIFSFVNRNLIIFYFTKRNIYDNIY